MEIYHASDPKIYLNYNNVNKYFLRGSNTTIDIGNDVGGAGKNIRFMPNNIERFSIDGTTGTMDPLNQKQRPSTNVTCFCTNKTSSPLQNDSKLSPLLVVHCG